MSDVLEIQLFGTPRFTWNENVSIRMAGGKSLALWVYLVTTRQPQARDLLADLLWSEFSNQQARNNLRYILPDLRKTMGDYLITSTQSIGFNTTLPYRLDVETVSAILSKPLTEIKTCALQRAVDLYQDEFLAGLRVRNAPRFEDWVRTQREAFHLLLIQGLQELAERYLAAADYLTGLVATQRLLTLEPWHETGHRLSMHYLALTGQRSAALAQFETCRTILADELGLDPSMPTVKLYEQILTGTYGQNAASNVPTAPVILAEEENESEDDQEQPPPDTIPHNLPAALSKLIGYTDELAYMQTQLTSDACRLLTIIGMGGAGKTHLALEAARQLVAGADNVVRFRDGIYFVSLDAIDEALSAEAAETAIALAIADAMGYSFRGQAAPQHQLQTYLRSKQLLLILDNVEHLLVGVPLITGLLQHAEKLTILATSREKLDLQGEHLLELHGLMGRPTDDHYTWQDNAAVALFAYRAQLLDRHFGLNEENLSHIMRVCQLVGGLPLGIELAAQGVNTLDCQTIADEIAQSMDFLLSTRRDSHQRHHTLRAVFNRSWTLLSPLQQMMLARLSLFHPNFSSAAAMGVAGVTLSDLSNLVNKSLVKRNANGGFFLHRSIRQFAREKLYQFEGDDEILEERYVSFYLDCLIQSADVVHSPQWMEAKTKLLQDIDNVKSALRLAIQKKMWGGFRAAFETVANLYDQQGWPLEGYDFFQMAITQITPALDSYPLCQQQQLKIVLGYLLTMQGWYNTRMGRFSSAQSRFQDGLSILRQLQADINTNVDTSTAVVDSMQQTLSICLRTFGLLENWRDQPMAALALLQEAEALDVKKKDMVITVYGLSEVMYRLGDYVAAQAYAERGLSLAHQVGIERYINILTTQLGAIEQARGDYAAAEKLYQAGYRGRIQSGMQMELVNSMIRLGNIAHLQGDEHGAQAYLQRGIAAVTGTDYRVAYPELLWSLGQLALEQGDYAVAKARFLKSRSSRGFSLLRVGLPTLGWAYMGLAEFVQAEEYLREVIQAAWPVKAYYNLMEALACLSVLFSITGELADPGETIAIIEQHPATTQESKDRLHKMYTQIITTAPTQLPATAGNYQPSPELCQLFEEILRKI